MSQSQVQEGDRLIDPRRTRLHRLQVAKRAEEQGNSLKEGVSANIVPPNFVEVAFFTHSLSVSTTEIFAQNSVDSFELGIGDLNDAMYIRDVHEVTCTKLNCNKRTTNMG